MVDDAEIGRRFISALPKAPGRPDIHGGRSRRTSVRRPVNVQVGIEGKTNDAWALNLSSGGVRIVSDAPLEVDEHVLLRFGDGPSALYGYGRVVWVQRHGEDVIAGIQFTDEKTRAA